MVVLILLIRLGMSLSWHRGMPLVSSMLPWLQTRLCVGVSGCSWM